MRDYIQRALSYLGSVRFLRFLETGALSAGLYFVIFSMLWRRGVAYDSASLWAFSIVFVANFVLHKLWTFQSERWGTAIIQLGLFSLKKWIFFAANIALLAYCVDGVGMHPLVAQIIIGTAGGIATYFIYKYVFKI